MTPHRCRAQLTTAASGWEVSFPSRPPWNPKSHEMWHKGATTVRMDRPLCTPSDLSFEIPVSILTSCSSVLHSMKNWNHEHLLWTHTQKCRQEFNQKNQSAQPMNLIRQPPFTVARVRFTNNGPHGVVMSTFSSRALLMLDRDVASGNGASFSSDNSSARAAWLTNFFLPKSASMAESSTENGIR